MKKLIYILLFPLYLMFLSVMYLRNCLYDLGLLKTKKIGCKVISVGNISMGGTGKTPIVISLAKRLQKNYTVAVLSRGYGRTTDGTQLVSSGNGKITDWREVGDEPYLIANNLSEIPVVVDENRLRGGKYLVDRFNPDIIILDDGFQHRRLHRDIDIVLIDTSRPTFSEYFREPLQSIKRADLVLLTKGRGNKSIDIWQQRIQKYSKPIFYSVLSTANFLVSYDGKYLDLKKLKNNSVLLFSGIGNPDYFKQIIYRSGFNILDFLIFRDHHIYTNSDIEKIRTKHNQYNPDIIITTEKDMIKLPKTDLPIYALPINMELNTDTSNWITNNLK